MTTGCSLPDSSRYIAPRASEYLVPSLKMLPTSITFSTESGRPHCPHASPAVTVWRSANRASKSRPGTELLDDLLGMSGSELGPDRPRQLPFVRGVVAAHEDEDEPRRRRVQERLDGQPRVDLQQ